jgi:hypothetical protein
MSHEINLVIVHYLDKKIRKGTTQDFFPNRPSFHLLPADGSKMAEIRCRDLKAVFFVKDLEGNPTREDVRGFIDRPGETQHGKKLAVRFKDGEIICGYSLSYTPGRDGFFLIPADQGSNNLRVYVVTSAAAEIGAGPAADRLAQKAVDQGGKRRAA